MTHQPGQIIGRPFDLTGLFYEPKKDRGHGLVFQTQYHNYYASASSALASLILYNFGISMNAPPLRRVYVPSYTCPKFTTAIYLALESLKGYSRRKTELIRYGYSPLDYPAELIRNVPTLLPGLSSGNPVPWNEVNEDDLVIIPDYFGFQNTGFHFRDQVKQAINANTTVIQDFSQNLFADPSHLIPGTYGLYSPRKFMGLVDGGVLARNEWPENEGSNNPSGLIIPGPSIRSHQEDHDAYLEWYCLSHSGLRNPELTWPTQKAERMIPRYAFVPVTESTRITLEYMPVVAADAAKTLRRDNYKQLLQRLGEFSLFTELPETVTPLGFPVIVHDANEIQSKMYLEHKIHCHRHWNLDEKTHDFPVEHISDRDLQNANTLSKHLLTLPCDQRYSTKVMDHIADCLTLCLLNS